MKSGNFANIALLILAGGQASRVGFPKGLFPIAGSCWLHELIVSALDIGFKNITVVTGIHHEAYKTSLSSFPSVNVVQNTKHELGPFASLQAGLASLMENKVAGVFVLPVDLALPSVPSLLELGNFIKLEKVIVPFVSISCTSPQVSPSIFRKKYGHFIYLPLKTWSKILACSPLSPSGRLDRFLAELAPSQKEEVELCDARILINMNTLKEWEKFSPILLKDRQRSLKIRFREEISWIYYQDPYVLALLPRSLARESDEAFPVWDGEFIPKKMEPLIHEYYSLEENELFLVQNKFTPCELIDKNREIITNTKESTLQNMWFHKNDLDAKFSFDKKIIMIIKKIIQSWQSESNG